MAQSELVGHPPELSDTTVSSVRVLYPDLHGVPRGKDVPLVEFDRVSEHGLGFCAAVMSTDLRHTPVLGGEIGYPDLIARPDLSTLTLLPWEPGVACCIADVHPVARAAAAPADPRGAVRRAVAAFEELGLAPIVGPELEFFLCERDPSAPGGLRRYVDNLSMVYTVGPQADPRGVVRQMTEALAGMGMGTFAANHEFMNSQYEINLRHAPALTAADRAFRLKSAVKDIAAQARAARDVHGQAVQRPGRLRLPPARQRRPRRRQRVRRARRSRRRVRRAAPLHRRRARARAGADGVPQPDDQRLPADRPRLARADQRQLGLGQPHDVRPHPGRARAARRASRSASATAARTRTSRSPRRCSPACAACARSCRCPTRSAATRTRRRPAAPSRSASRRRSTRSRPTTTCATRSATAIVTPFLAMKRFEIERHRELGLRLGARRVPPPPLRGRDDADRDHRPLRPRRVRRRGARTSGSARCAARRRSTSTPSPTAPASTRSPATRTSARSTATSTSTRRRSAARRSRTSTRSSSRRASR